MSCILGIGSQVLTLFLSYVGEFNHAYLCTSLPTFHQIVMCPTRDNKTLDLLYANTQDACRSTALPPLGRSDHNLVLISPTYTLIVQWQPVTTRTVRRWSQETHELLQGCFEAADWDVLCEPHGNNIDSLTDCITDYISFCVPCLSLTDIPSCTGALQGTVLSPFLFSLYTSDFKHNS